MKDYLGKACTPRPVFAWLHAQPNPGPAGSPYPSWNFHKYLVSRDGKLVKHWPESQQPGADASNPIGAAIIAELAKPKP